MSHEYDDILFAERPVSPKHPPMSRGNRAAQFAAFAALNGYDDVIEETARLTDSAVFLDENEKEELDRRLRLLDATLDYQPSVTLRYFKRDVRKSGGRYLVYEGKIKKLDKHRGLLVTAEGTEVAFSDIAELSGDWLSFFESGE